MRTAPRKGGSLSSYPRPLRRGQASFRKEVPQWAHWGGGLYFAAGEMYEINKVCKTLFTSYVLLRKTQSSVSLRLTAPFKRGFLERQRTSQRRKSPPCQRGGRRTQSGGGGILCPRTPVEKPQEVILPEPPQTETESKPSQEPAPQPPAQQEPVEQQSAQEPQQQDDEPQGGGDSAADIEARKKAFLENMEQMFEDHGYTTDGSDHDMTDEEFRALQKAMGMYGG